MAHVFMHWGGSLMGRFEVALESPRYETLEYLRTYIGYKDWFIIIYSLIILFILFNSKIKYNCYSKFLKIISIIVCALIYFFVLIHYNPFKQITYGGFERILKGGAIESIRDKYLSTLKSKKNNKGLYDKVIIIQGESANKNHLQIYGYGVNTTPYLSKLYKSKKLFILNAISGANTTSYAVPMVFTKANVLNWQKNYIHSPSILTDFANSSYETYWISNQGHVEDDTIVDIAKEANIQKFFNSGDYTEAKTDMIIKKYLAKLKINNNKEFYVFHLIGSHARYASRYNKLHILYKNPKNIFQEYDNTIYFTDFIIKSIIRHFSNSKKLLVIYLSDHGEIVSQKKHGHGFLHPHKNEYQIPFIIYSSIKNNRISKIVNDNKKHYFNEENFNYIIKYISGISNDNNISYEFHVFSAGAPKNILNYDKLKTYKEMNPYFKGVILKPKSATKNLIEKLFYLLETVL